MKIGLVCPYNIDRSGGVLEVVLALKAELTDRGHQVKIITPYPRNPEKEKRPDIIFAGTIQRLRYLALVVTKKLMPF
jgi:glycogen synthase